MFTINLSSLVPGVAVASAGKRLFYFKIPLAVGVNCFGIYRERENERARVRWKTGKGLGSKEKGLR